MFNRSISLIGLDNYQKIKDTNVLVLGLGGVGGYIIEGLIRSGIENITIVDYDTIDISNLNRQIIATNDNIGNNKTDEWKKRILLINPKVKVNTITEKITNSNIDLLFQKPYNYIIDACDTITVKKLLIKRCIEENIHLLTVCGMGKRLNPNYVKICDIRDTSNDPIAKILRKYVKDENITQKVPCVWSSELPISTNDKVVSSMIMVPSTAGNFAVSYVINDIIKNK